MSQKITRRQLLRMATATGGGLLLQPLSGCSRSDSPASPSAEPTRLLSFAALPEASDWGSDWTSVGVADLWCENGEGVLQAGSDIFPNDPRPVAFARDARMLDGGIRAVITAAGSSVGAVLRRNSVRDYYAAVYDTDNSTLAILRRSGFDLVELAQRRVLPDVAAGLPGGQSVTLEFTAIGSFPTRLTAKLTTAGGMHYEAVASDDAAALQAPGDPGVLTQSHTLLPGSSALLPALGNLHLLPYTVQEGQAFFATPAGKLLIETIRRRSTARFAEIEIRPEQDLGPTAASVVAATTGAPIAGGAMLHVASDAPAEVLIDVATNPDFSDARVVQAGMTDPQFLATTTAVGALGSGTVYWRPRLRRAGLETMGPVRKFRVLPAGGSAAAFTLAYGSCGSQFNAIFDHIAARQPHLFMWQGDLNYADAHGPFAQNMAGYAGIWRHFLDNPRMAPILEHSCFVAGRDDHDYGQQDSNAARLLPWGLAPWEALMNPRTYQQISAGLADIWVLDQRQFKSDPTQADTPEKSLLGAEQRRWLFDGLAASRAPFQIICSPCTLAPSGVANARDGSWAAGYTVERDLLLAHIADQVRGQAIFLSGDTHFTMLWERDGLFEQRACPLDIPQPNDITVAEPLLEATFAGTPGVRYWSRRSHFSFISVGAEGPNAVLTVELVRDDGLTVHSRRFEIPLKQG